MVTTVCIMDAFSPVAVVEFLPFKVMVMLLMQGVLGGKLFSSRLLVIFTRALLQSPREAKLRNVSLFWIGT